MNWKQSLSELINDSGYPDIEIYAWTGIPVATISNMSNKKHKYLTCEQFILFKLLFKETHTGLLAKLFGKNHFDKIKKIEEDLTLTKLGKYFKESHHYEAFPKKKLVDATGLKSSRIDYIFETNDSNIRIDEITKLEIVAGEKLGSLSELLFPAIRLKSDEEYQNLLREQREINKLANERRKNQKGNNIKTK